MAKWHDKIGFVTTVENPDEPGVWEEQFTERFYRGDMTRSIRRLQSSGGTNDNVTITNELSIVADPFANENFHAIRYACYMGAKWKVDTVTAQRPRLILTLGEVYNARPS